jgi:hypothetical protein
MADLAVVDRTMRGHRRPTVRRVLTGLVLVVLWVPAVAAWRQPNLLAPIAIVLFLVAAAHLD